MSAEQTPDIAALAAVLAEHRLSNVVCTCMAWSAAWGDDRPAIAEGHRAHVAAALAPVLAAAVQRALREAADALEPIIWTDPNVAAWLRDRADRITEPVSHEGDR